MFIFGTYLDEALMMVTAPAGAATKRYHHADHLYSVYALTDAAGAVVERRVALLDALGRRKR